MKKTKSQSIIFAGAIIIIAIFIATSLFSYYQLDAIKRELQKVNNLYSTKKNILLEMASIIRERELGVFTLYVLKDPWDKDAEYMRYYSYGPRFIEIRDQYKALGLTAYEEKVFNEALGHIRDLEPLEEGVVDALKDKDDVDIQQYLVDVNIPGESNIQALVDELIVYAQSQLDKAQLDSEDSIRQAKISFTADTLFSVMVLLFLVVYVYSRITYYERRLHDDKAMAEATVNSVTDGIIITDHAGKVVDINPVAQLFVRKGRAETIGARVNEIFHLHDINNNTTIHYWDTAANADGPFSLVSRDAYLYDDDEAVLVECTISPVFNQEGKQTSVCYFFKEVTNERRLRDEINWQATHDPLTGVLNRSAFEQRLKNAISTSLDKDLLHALLFIDLDNFKPINDTYGHTAGDEMLKGLCRQIELSIRASDVMARMGGDEFAVLLSDCPHEKVSSIGENILQKINEYSLSFNGDTIPCGGASIGMTFITPEDLDAMPTMSKALRYMFEQADRACYKAKNSGKNHIVTL